MARQFLYILALFAIIAWLKVAAASDNDTSSGNTTQPEEPAKEKAKDNGTATTTTLKPKTATTSGARFTSPPASKIMFLGVFTVALFVCWME